MSKQLGSLIDIEYNHQPIFTNKLEARPCLVYHDLVIGSRTSDAAFLTFDNYYVAYITVKQHQYSGKHKWVTVLKNYPLMKHCHYEDDSQKRIILDFKLFNQKYINYSKLSKKTVMRIFIYQPSPCWIQFQLRNIRCYTACDLSSSDDESDAAPRKIGLVNHHSFNSPSVQCSMLRVASDELRDQLEVLKNLRDYQTQMRRPILPSEEDVTSCYVLNGLSAD